MQAGLHPTCHVGPKSKAPGQPGDAGLNPAVALLQDRVSPFFVATAFQQNNRGECRKDYIACNAPGRGFESRRVQHGGP